MQERETVQRLLRAVGDRVGAPLLLDADGACAMTYGHGLALTVEASEGTGCVLLHAPVAEVPGEPEAFFRRVLKLNLMAAETGGCVLGLDDEAGAILLAHIQSLDRLDPLGFENLLANFIDRAAAIRAILAAPMAAQGVPAAPRDDGLPMQNFDMRV